jgi:hypothetical protein
VCVNADAVHCVAYDFNGGFKNFDSSGLLDEKGNKIPNIKEYYT